MPQKLSRLHRGGSLHRVPEGNTIMALTQNKYGLTPAFNLNKYYHHSKYKNQPHTVRQPVCLLITEFDKESKNKCVF